jgi:hypothetical protein
MHSASRSNKSKNTRKASIGSAPASCSKYRNSFKRRFHYFSKASRDRQTNRAKRTAPSFRAMSFSLSPPPTDYLSQNHSHTSRVRSFDAPSLALSKACRAKRLDNPSIFHINKRAPKGSVDFEQGRLAVASVRARLRNWPRVRFQFEQGQLRLGLWLLLLLPQLQQVPPQIPPPINLHKPAEPAVSSRSRSALSAREGSATSNSSSPPPPSPSHPQQQTPASPLNAAPSQPASPKIRDLYAFHFPRPIRPISVTFPFKIRGPRLRSSLLPQRARLPDGTI